MSAGSKSVFVEFTFETIRSTPFVNSLCRLQQLLSNSDDIRLSDNEIFIFLSRKGVRVRILRRRQYNAGDAFLQELIKENKEMKRLSQQNEVQFSIATNWNNLQPGAGEIE
jgi:hypothetical protein